MSEFWQGLGLLCATILGAAGVSFGLRAGLEFAHYVFGPFNISVRWGNVNVHSQSSAANNEGFK